MELSRAVEMLEPYRKFVKVMPVESGVTWLPPDLREAVATVLDAVDPPVPWAPARNTRRGGRP